MNKRVLFVLIFFSWFTNSRAQSGATFLSQNFDAYQASPITARILLTLNQDKFSPGDTVWFNAYFLTANSNKVKGKRLIDVNLISDKNQVIHHIIFEVNDGLAQNQLVLPDTLTAGIYLITAHHRGAKDPASIFRKEIFIVNKNSIVRNEKPQHKVVVEGGHLIQSFLNKAVIQTQAGSVLQLKDSHGKKIDDVTADQHGTASIVFTPSQNISYFIQLIGDSLRIPLPEVENDGCAILLTQSDRREPVKLRVASPPVSPLRDQELVLVVIAKGKICYSTTFQQGAKDVVELEIPQDNLSHGISSISLLTKNGKLIASRDFFSDGEDTVQVKLQTSQNNFRTREKVRVEVSVVDGKGQPVEGEFSVSVTNAGLFETKKRNSIPLFKEYDFSRSDANWMKSLDNLLILSTQEIPWREIINHKNADQVITSNQIEKRGKAYFLDTGKPLPDLTQIMFYLQKSKFHHQTFTQHEGQFWLMLPEVVGQDEFFYLARLKGEDKLMNVKIVWDEAKIKLPSPPASKESSDLDHYATFAKKKKTVDQSFGYNILLEVTKTDESKDFEQAIAKPDIAKNIQEYVLFSSMTELLKEAIPSVFCRTSKNKIIVRVQVASPMVATDDPVYIIDGIATHNTDFFLSLKPGDLRTVKIIKEPKKLAPLGLLGKNGIIIVETKKGDVREPLDDPEKRLEGLSQPLDFKVLKFTDAARSSVPNFRSTIYWNPHIKTDSTGKAAVEFYCSDDIGQLQICVEGLTLSGVPFLSKYNVEVSSEVKK